MDTKPSPSADDSVSSPCLKFFEGNKVQKALDFIVLQVILMTSISSTWSNDEVVTHVDACSDTVASLKMEERIDWIICNETKLNKLYERIGSATVDDRDVQAKVSINQGASAMCKQRNCIKSYICCILTLRKTRTSW